MSQLTVQSEPAEFEEFGEEEYQPEIGSSGSNTPESHSSPRTEVLALFTPKSVTKTPREESILLILILFKVF